MFCGKCGAQLEDGAQFCGKCGHGVNDPITSTPTQTTKQSGGFAANLSDGVNRMENSDSFIFRSLGLTLKTLFSKPVRLWGLSLLGSLLTFLSELLCFMPPIFGLAVSNTLAVGMKSVFLDAYNGKQVDSKQLFSGFSSGKKFFRVAGGLLWSTLWLFIWGLLLVIPPVGIIAIIYKSLSYSFTPYILLKKEDVSPLDALKESMELTKGYKAKIFLTYLLVVVCLLVLALILALISMIPGVGIVLTVIASVLILVLLPLFTGTLEAAMFTEVIRLKEVKDIEL